MASTPVFSQAALGDIAGARGRPTPDRLLALKARLCEARTAAIPANEAQRLALEARALAEEARNIAGAFEVMAHELRTGDPF